MENYYEETLGVMGGVDSGEKDLTGFLLKAGQVIRPDVGCGVG